MSTDLLNKYAVCFLTDRETLWFVLDKWYFLKEWRGIRFKEDIQCLSDTRSEFKFKLAVNGWNIGRRLFRVENDSDMVKYCKASMTRSRSNIEYFRVKIYEITAADMV